MTAKARRVLVVGARGRMGECVRAALAREPGLRLAAALEVPGHPDLGQSLEHGVELVDDADTALAACDVAIDFSAPAATLATLAHAAARGVAYVTGTTGLSEAQQRELAGHARKTAIVHAPNFSVAVNVLAWLAREAVRRLGPGYDAEILELHHGAKRDAPSGTALRLAEAVAEARGEALAEHLVVARAGDTGARPPGAIGVAALRGGDAVGDHTVYFLGAGERLELTHRAQSRECLARGALRAALWVVGQKPGLYAMRDVLGL